MREVPLNTSRRALVTERLLRRPRNRKCRLVRDSILCCYGLGRAFLRTLIAWRNDPAWSEGKKHELSQLGSRTMQSEPELSRGPQRGKQVLYRHTHAVVRVDKASANNPIGADDEGGGNREHPIVAPL